MPVRCCECPGGWYVQRTAFFGYCLNLQRFVVASSNCDAEGT